MFSLGDIIKGIVGNGYYFTNENAVMEVVSVSSNNMKVRIIEHVYDRHIGQHWTVFNTESKFELVKGKAIKNGEKCLNKLLLKELTNLKVDSLDEDYRLTFTKDYLEVGCQRISKKDAIKIAKRILWAYGE